MSGYYDYDEPGPGHRRLTIAVVVSGVAIVAALLCLAGYLVRGGPSGTSAHPPGEAAPSDRPGHCGHHRAAGAGGFG